MTTQVSKTPEILVDTLSEELKLPPVSSLQESFASGSYPAWLQEEMKREETAPHLVRDIAAEFEGMKSLSPEQRMEDYNWIVRYYSRSNKNFEDTSLKLFEHLGCNEEKIREGTYNSDSVALHLAKRMEEYDTAAVVPIVKQVRNYLANNFPNTNILFLGRDFCSVYLYIVNEGILNLENLYLANVSRYVRDVALGGQTTELRLVLERIGLTKENLLKKGLLIADSCMQGKIPAIILKSLALGMDESERYRFLTHSYVRYLKSSRNTGLSVAEKAKEVGVNGLLTREDLDVVLAKRIEMIEEFKVDYPQAVEEYVEKRRHKIFEWRPKVSLIAMGIEVDELGARLIADEPKTPSEKILCALGLYAEIQLAKKAQEVRPLIVASSSDKNGKSGAPHGNFNPQKMALEVSLLEKKFAINHAVSKRVGHHVVSGTGENYVKPVEPPSDWYFKEIDEALRDGIEGLRQWEKNVDTSQVGSVAVMRTKDVNFRYELVINGKLIYHFKDIIGEGNNVKVYTTDKGTVVKVIKNERHVRKNLLLAWAEPLVQSVGIKAAKVLNVSPTGLYVEQEAIPGPSLEELYGETNNIPAKICEMAALDLRAAKKLIKEKGIWLDLKSANYHLSEDEKIVNVDYAPRLNPTFYRYFKSDPDENGEQRDLTEDESLEKFFHHDAKKRCAAKLGEKK